jgi:CRP-like cAMP-binding protein
MDPKIEAKIKNFFSKFKRIEFEKGEGLLRAEDEVDSVYLLVGGVVRCYSITESGQDITINTFRPVSFFPLGPALNKTSNHYYYQALTNVLTFKAPNEKVLDFLKSDPEVVLDLMGRIYRGLDGYMERVEKLAEGNAYGRLVQAVLIMARRFGRIDGNKVTVTLKMTETDLASQTGLTRETVSRTLAALKAKGLLEFSQRTITIPDLNKFEAE